MDSTAGCYGPHGQPYGLNLQQTDVHLAQLRHLGSLRMLSLCREFSNDPTRNELQYIVNENGPVCCVAVVVIFATMQCNITILMCAQKQTSSQLTASLRVMTENITQSLQLVTNEEQNLCGVSRSL